MLAYLFGGWRLPLVLILIAVIPRLAYLFIATDPFSLPGDEIYYFEIASNVINGEGFMEGNLLAYRPPLYPMFLAGSLIAFQGNLLVIRLIQVIIGAVMCLLVFHLGKRVFSTGPGLVAGLLCAVYPQMIYYNTQILPEQLLMLLVCVAVYFMVNTEKNTMFLQLVCGIAIGLTALTKEIGLFLLPAYVIWVLFNRSRITSPLKRLALVIVGV